MKLEGKIENIITDGYERLIYLNVTTRQKKLWVHLIQHNEYLEKGDQSQFLHVDQNVTINVGIDWVNDYLVLSQPVLNEELTQPLRESSYTIAVATIIGKEDDYTLFCDIPNLGNNVMVEFEEKVSLEIGAILRLKGNLKANFDDE